MSKGSLSSDKRYCRDFASVCQAIDDPVSSCAGYVLMLEWKCYLDLCRLEAEKGGMPDTNTQETKEKDPVSAIKRALIQVRDILRNILGPEEEKLKEEMEEVEGSVKPDKLQENQPEDTVGN